LCGIKGGGTGGGRAQLAPMESINLHLTGTSSDRRSEQPARRDDRLARRHGNELGIDPDSITWRRCVDMDDRAPRRVVVGLENDSPRETGFDIAAASEVMAIVAMAQCDIVCRLGGIAPSAVILAVTTQAPQAPRRRPRGRAPGARARRRERGDQSAHRFERSGSTESWPSTPFRATLRPSSTARGTSRSTSAPRRW
jgi:hypothetical protein